MKQKLFIVLALIILVITLIGLNAVSYTQKDTLPDSEDFPNRSTFNSGSTGTRAFYELLAETNRNVMRWQENPAALLGTTNKPSTFVIIGATRREITDAEAVQILRWVSEGGKLVIIDRYPDKDLIATTANWSIATLPSKEPNFNVDPSDQKQMTEKTAALKPVQPTIFTRSVNAVQPSRFASSIVLDFFGEDAATVIKTAPAEAPGTAHQFQDERTSQDEEPPPAKTPKPSIDIKDELPPPMKTPSQSPFPVIETPVQPDKVETIALNAPFVHLADKEKTILADFPYGSGQIVYLTDPYIVSNAGISIVDNAQLAINVVASRDGLIAFDEYHHGYGAGENRLLEYFGGTPVLWIFAQVILLILVILWSQSRRFARPLPAAEPSRLSKLEYVSAFAELQQRTKAYDLALENIYREFRRSMTRIFGMDNYTTSNADLARMIAERGKLNEMQVYNLMEHCEEIIHGESTGKKEVLRLTSSLREIEEILGVKRSRRNK